MRILPIIYIIIFFLFVECGESTGPKGPRIIRVSDNNQTIFLGETIELCVLVTDNKGVPLEECSIKWELIQYPNGDPIEYETIKIHYYIIKEGKISQFFTPSSKWQIGRYEAKATLLESDDSVLFNFIVLAT